MASTTPDNLWSPDVGTAFVPTVDLARMQDTVQAALVARPANYRVGTNAARIALTGAALFEGLRYYATDTNRDWFYDGAVWLPADPGAYLIRPTTVSGGTINSDGTVSVTSGAASIRIDGVFSTRFRRYQVIGNVLPTTQAYLSMQVSNGGSIVSSGYGFQRLNVNSASVVAGFNGSGPGFAVSGNLGTEHSIRTVFVNPAHISRTLFESNIGSFPTGTCTGTGYTSATAAYDGFAINPDGATSFASGNIAVYGMV